MKYLLLLALLGFVWWRVFKRKEPTGSLEPDVSPAENMVTCAHCGVHLPESEAVCAGGAVYCSDAHRRAAAEEV